MGVDGNTLYAKAISDSKNFYRISRGSSDFELESWESAAAEISPGKQDLTFFQYDQQSYMITAVRLGAGRRLELCIPGPSGWDNCHP